MRLGPIPIQRVSLSLVSKYCEPEDDFFVEAVAKVEAWSGYELYAEGGEDSEALFGWAQVTYTGPIEYMQVARDCDGWIYSDGNIELECY